MSLDNAAGLCDQLIADLAVSLQSLTSGVPVTKQKDAYVSVLDGKMLVANLIALETALDQGMEGDLIGTLETNALLTSFANTWFRDRQTRAERWRDSHADLLLAGNEYGPLKRQLSGVGTKVDSVWAMSLTAKPKGA